MKLGFWVYLASENFFIHFFSDVHQIDVEPHRPSLPSLGKAYVHFQPVFLYVSDMKYHLRKIVSLETGIQNFVPMLRIWTKIRVTTYMESRNVSVNATVCLLKMFFKILLLTLDNEIKIPLLIIKGLFSINSVKSIHFSNFTMVLWINSTWNWI